MKQPNIIRKYQEVKDLVENNRGEIFKEDLDIEGVCVESGYFGTSQTSVVDPYYMYVKCNNLDKEVYSTIVGDFIVKYVNSDTVLMPYFDNVVDIELDSISEERDIDVTAY